MFISDSWSEYVCMLKKVVILKEMPVVVLQMQYLWMQNILLVNLFYKKYIVTIREFDL